MRHRSLLRRRGFVASLVAVGLVVALATSGGSASAQSVESLRDKASRIAAELDQLAVRSGQLNEQYLQTQQDISDLQAEQELNAIAVTEAQSSLDTTRQQAAGYLVEAYMGAGAYDQIAIGSASPNEAVNQQVLLEVLKGDRERMSDGIAADKDDLEQKASELEDSGVALEALQGDQARIVDQLESSVDRQQELLNSTKGELDAAVKAEQARVAAAAAATAQAHARAAIESAAATARADARAAAEAAAARTTSAASARTAPVTAPRTGAAPSAPVFEPPPVPASPSNSGAAGAIAAAKTRLGTPYRWGGTTPAGFDCSGLMLWSWAQVGVSLPRTSGAQRSATQRITFEQLQPGDLVFTGNPIHHVGMYIGGGQMIHSPQTGDVVKISAVRSGSSVTYGRIG